NKRISARSAWLRISTPLARMMAPAKKAVVTKAVRKPAAQPKSSGRRTEVTEIPQSLEKAATKAGIFLYTNDAWSLRCFDPNDLHSLEESCLVKYFLSRNARSNLN